MKKIIVLLFAFGLGSTARAQFSQATPFNTYVGLMVGGGSTHATVDYATPALPNFLTQDISEKYYALTYRGPVLKVNLYNKQLYLGGYFGCSVGGTISSSTTKGHNTGTHYVPTYEGVSDFNAFADVMTGLQLGYKLDSQTSFGIRVFIWDNRYAANYLLYEQDNRPTIAGFLNYKKLGVEINRSIKSPDGTNAPSGSGFSHTMIELRYKFKTYSSGLGMIVGARYDRAYLNRTYQVDNYYGWGTMSGPGNQFAFFFGFGR